MWGVMKYILFLLCILFFNLNVFAEGGLKVNGPNINLGGSNSDYMTPTPDFSGSMNNKDRFTIGSGSDPFQLSPPPDFTFGSISASGGIRFGPPTCSVRTPQVCQLYTSCRNVGGHWNVLDSKCEPAECIFGSTPEPFHPTRCRCNDEVWAVVERGNYLQNCPSQCSASQNKQYSFISKGCVCNEGYTMSTNGTCTADPQPATPDESLCWRELAEKANSCETDSNVAVSQCDSGENDSLKAISGILISTAGSAQDNCERAATAGTSSFYKSEETFRLCDERINSCKTTCTDAKTYLNANKDRVYNACRDRAFSDQVNAGPPLPPDRFNPMYDGQNKATFESAFQSYIAKVDSSQATCETGTAATNRSTLSSAMNEMNTVSKNANKCVCQLGSTSADCAKVVGPADCSTDSTLPGCSKLATVNCFDPKNTTLKCICFRNPDSVECTGAMPKINVKENDIESSAFAGMQKGIDTRGNGESDASGFATGKTTMSDSNVGLGKSGSELYAEATLDAPPAAASGSAFSSEASARGVVAPSAPAGLSGGGAARGGGSSAAAPEAANNFGVASKLGAFFENAKSAIGGVFKKGASGSNSSGDDYRDNGQRNNPAFDAKKFRPRNIVRGIASDNDIAGKHEDIWKVMNKQYKVQDQKDNFIFDTDKK